MWPRTIADVFAALHRAGYRVDMLLEPEPVRSADPARRSRRRSSGAPARKASDRAERRASIDPNYPGLSTLRRGSDDGKDALAHGGRLGPESREDTHRRTVVERKYAEQQVLGADVVVPGANDSLAAFASACFASSRNGDGPIGSSSALPTTASRTRSRTMSQKPSATAARPAVRAGAREGDARCRLRRPSREPLRLGRT